MVTDLIKGNIPSKLPPLAPILPAIVLLFAGCVNTPNLDLPCPPRPLLEVVTEEEQMAMDASVLGRVAQNQLKLKSYAKRLESRAGCEW